MASSDSWIDLRASSIDTSLASPACTCSMVCRLCRWIWVAAGVMPTSTIASSGTSLPFGARTMKVDRSSTP